MLAPQTFIDRSRPVSTCARRDRLFSKINAIDLGQKKNESIPSFHFDVMLFFMTLSSLHAKKLISQKM